MWHRLSVKLHRLTGVKPGCDMLQICETEYTWMKQHCLDLQIGKTIIWNV